MKLMTSQVLGQFDGKCQRLLLVENSVIFTFLLLVMIRCQYNILCKPRGRGILRSPN